MEIYSRVNMKNKQYYIDKYNLCKENGIDLIHIF